MAEVVRYSNGSNQTHSSPIKTGTRAKAFLHSLAFMRIERNQLFFRANPGC